MALSLPGKCLRFTFLRIAFGALLLAAPTIADEKPPTEVAQDFDSILSKLHTFSLSPLGEGAPVISDQGENQRHCVLVFIAADCPISNRFAPELGRIRVECENAKMQFFVVYAEPDKSQAELRKHAVDFSFLPFALWDNELRLARACGANRVPEAVVIANDVQDRLVYRGRIDDRYVAFGKMKPEPARRDLRDAIEGLKIDRNVPFREQEAIGCNIPYPRDSETTPSIRK